MANPTNPFATTFLGHDDNFERIVGILLFRIKGQDLAPQKTTCPSSTLYKWRWIPCPKKREIRIQNREKNDFLHSFSFPPLSHHFCPLPQQCLNRLSTTNHLPVFPATPRTSPVTFLLRPDEFSFVFPPPKPPTIA